MEEKFVKNFLFQNFSRKAFSLLAAIIVWIVVSHSINTTKIFHRVPVRIVNVPQDKTIRGLMPNGILDRRISLTLTGSKDVLSKLDSKDFEVVIDASDKGNEWVVKVGKKNLVSLNPDIDLIHHIKDVSNNEFILKLSKLVTDKIPIYFAPPVGEPPEGYQFLDIWPQRVSHTVSGAEEDVKALQAKGITITFDLSNITKDELDALKGGEMMQSDEIGFPVPDSWKKVSIPFLRGVKQEINGPEAKLLRIDFLRKEVLPLEREVPIRVFYPLQTSGSINPLNFPLIPNNWIVNKNGLMVVTKPLYVAEVSRLFLDVVRDRLEIVVIATPKGISQPLPWEVQFIDPEQLEEDYVAKFLHLDTSKEEQALAQALQKNQLAQRKQFLRERFQVYMQKLKLMSSKDHMLKFHAQTVSKGIVIVDQETK